MTVAPAGTLPVLVWTASTQATFLPSGERATCSKVCAAKRVLITWSRSAADLGFAADCRRRSTSCFVPGFSCAEDAIAKHENQMTTIKSLDAHIRILTSELTSGRYSNLGNTIGASLSAKNGCTRAAARLESRRVGG